RIETLKVQIVDTGDGHHRPQEVDLGQDPLDLAGGLPHLIELLRGQLRLRHELAGNGELPEVVDQARPPQLLELRSGEVEFLTDELCEVGDPFGMTACIEVPGFEGFDEPPEGSLVCLPQLRIRRQRQMRDDVYDEDEDHDGISADDPQRSAE